PQNAMGWSESCFPARPRLLESAQSRWRSLSRRYPPLSRSPQHSLLASLLQPVRQSADISRIAATASSQVTNAFGPSRFAEFLKLAPRNLDRLKLVRESRVACEGMALVSRTKCGRLRRERHLDRAAHLPQQRNHPLRVLFAVRAHS